MRSPRPTNSASLHFFIQFIGREWVVRANFKYINSLGFERWCTSTVSEHKTMRAALRHARTLGDTLIKQKTVSEVMDEQMKPFEKLARRWKLAARHNLRMIAVEKFASKPDKATMQRLEGVATQAFRSAQELQELVNELRHRSQPGEDGRVRGKKRK